MLCKNSGERSKSIHQNAVWDVHPTLDQESATKPKSNNSRGSLLFFFLKPSLRIEQVRDVYVRPPA